jgi:hypothetical protein
MNLTKALKIVFEQRRPRLMDFVDVVFPRVLTFESETIPVDQIVPSLKLAGYRSRESASNVLTYQPGKGYIGRPPIVALKTMVSEDLAGEQTVGMEDTDAPNSQLLRKYAYIQDQQAEAIYATIVKQASDILTAGAFTPTDALGNKVDEPIDYERDPALTISGNYGADVTKMFSDAYAQLKKKGIPSVGIFAIVGGDIMALLQKSPDFQALLKIQGLNAGKIWVSPDNKVVAQIVSNMLLPGFAAPLTILSFDEMYDDNGVITPYIPARSIVMSSFNSERIQAYGGVVIAESGNLQVYAGQIVSDRFISKEPDGLVLRSQSRPLLIPGNINHTACVTYPA